MSPAFAALLSALVSAVVPVLISWFQNHVLKNSPALLALDKAGKRAAARQWVVDAVNELSTAIIAKLNLPSWVASLLPPVDAILEQAVDAALDATAL